ncbi:MAG: family 16 glycoside hydrolase, partial [Phycisphaerales bacterium JB063]
TLRGDQWVTFEIEVHGNQRAIHRVNGEVVADYGPLVLDENDSGSAGDAETQRRGTTDLTHGTISLQAESAPIEFREIRIKMLGEDESE